MNRPPEPLPAPAEIASRLHDDVARLPMLPTVLLRLSMLDPESPSYFDDVQRLVHGDPGLAVRLLRLANSAGGGALAATTSIDLALLRVGARTAVELMLADKAASMFPAKDEWQRDLWVHSVLVANYMRRLAPMVIGAEIDANHAYLAGLLHDIGRFLMAALLPEAFEVVEDAGWDGPQGLLDAERQACGCTHTELAYETMTRWELPGSLARAARDHHREAPTDPAGAAEADAQAGALVTLLRDVDWLAMHVAREGMAWLEQPPADFEAQARERMRSRYRGAPEDRLVRLRSATAEASRLLAAIGLDDRDFRRA